MVSRLSNVFWVVSLFVLAACSSTANAPLPTMRVLPSPLPVTAVPATTVALRPTLPPVTSTSAPTNTALPTSLPATETPTPAPSATITSTPTLMPTTAPSSTPIPAAAVPVSDAIVSNEQGVNLRRGPSVDFGPPIALIDAETPLKLVAISSNLLWYKVETPDGQQGWAYSKMLTVTNKPLNLPVEVVAAPTTAPVAGGQTVALVGSVGSPSIVPLGSVSNTAPVISGGSIASIDLMVLYTTKVRDANGGDAAVQNSIALAVATANQAFINSGVNARLNLIHSEAVAFDEKNSLSTALSWVSADAGVAALRDTYQADIVSLVIESADTHGGLSLTMGPNMASNPMLMAPRAFNTMVYSGLSGGSRSLLIHEIGHTMGLQHEMASTEGQPIFSDAYGYQEPEGRFHDIMSYARDCDMPCVPVLYFSNPNMYFGSIPMGSSTANAARVLNYTAPYVAQFRSGTPPIIAATPAPVEPAIPAALTPRDPMPACTAQAADPAALREAISAANMDRSTTDVICLTSAQYELSGSTAQTFFPQIATPMVIIGNGATLARTGTNAFRFFSLISGGDLRLYDLTLKNGSVPQNGGAITNTGGTLTLYNVVLKENVSATYGQGGAIYSVYGTTRIINSRLEANSATYGGAIAASTGVVEIEHTVLYNNAGIYGGALYASDNATVSIHESCILRNSNEAVLGKLMTIDATNNWWGRSSGPMYGSAVIATGADRAGESVLAQPYQLRRIDLCPVG